MRVKVRLRCVWKCPMCQKWHAEFPLPVELNSTERQWLRDNAGQEVLGLPFCTVPESLQCRRCGEFFDAHEDTI